MTKEEAIKYLNTLYVAFAVFPNQQISLGNIDEMKESVSMALKALEQESTTKVLDKIRAEILEEKYQAYADFERYKVDFLGQDWEDVYDSLPEDDFRYGMERCLEIIDKYKAEREVQDADSN